MGALRNVWRRAVVWGAFSAALLAVPAALGDGKVWRLVLDGPLMESPREDAELAVLFGGAKMRTLLDLVREIDEAAENAAVRGMALVVEQPALSLAQVEELSRALGRFRAAGKPVYCYIDWASNVGYCLAAASADHITLAENSELAITGLSAEVSFYKNMFDKIGVKADMLRCGAYKAAAEPYIRSEPSPEFAENINWLLDGLYERWVEMVAEGRKLSPQEVMAAVDAGPLSAAKAQQAKLVDEVGSFDGFRKRIESKFGADAEIVKDLDADKLDVDLDMENPFAFFQEMNRVMEEMFGGAKDSNDPGIGIVYVDGGIVVGKSESSPLGGTVAGSTSVRAAIEQARRDEKVKAVVLRVDSPGGSAIASDIIWQAATQLASEKPLVVSMGSVAGSGGYYVSIPGETIFAERSTITASIGVVGGKLDWSELWSNKIGITTTEFHRGKHAGLMSFNRPWNDDERAWVTNWMNEIYEQFKGRIMSSRGPRIQGELETMAGGRVFTGKQALKLGLVDELGGVTDAIAHAAKKAGLEDPPVYTFPRKKGLAEVLAQLMGEPVDDDWEMSVGALVARDPALRAALPLLNEIAPSQVKGLLNALRNLALIQREHVGCFMPLDLHVR